MKNYNPIRGTNDYMPVDAENREIVKRIILDSYQNNGFNLISTPILENLEYLDSSDGGDNLRLMFKTIKRGDTLDLTKPNLTEKDLTEEGLRYDLTVPLSRFYANNKDKLPTPFKAIQIDYSFRAERPQRGRSRQFIQCDIDIIGDETVNAELELLKTSIETYKKLGFDDLVLKINSRKILNAIVLNAGFEENEIPSICITLDKLDKIAIQGVMMELIEKGFDTSKINTLIDTLNTITAKGIEAVKDFGVDEQTYNDMIFLINTLNALTDNSVKIAFDISIVRGQGYYTGTIYEFYTSGFGGAIGGGGRYDNMLKKLMGIDVPAVGASIGFEPVTMLVKERGINFNTKQKLALLYEQDDDILKVFEVKAKLQEKYNVSLFVKPKNMRAFYEKIVEVANASISVKDYLVGKEVKTF